MSEAKPAPQVVALFTAEGARADMTALQAAELEAGAGILGDRYHHGGGTFSPARMDPDHQLTLIEAEKIEAFEKAEGVSFGHGAFRRNVVTRGVDLNALVGARFRVGAATVRGVRLCEPCAHLAGMLDERVVKGLVHRAGLRAEILESGMVRPGDPIQLL